MDNITHALVGAVLSDLAVPSHVSPATRRLFVAAGVVASNAPDLDLVYVGITPMPLGYLLHHRGHTHTVPGLIVQAVLLVIVCELTMRWLARRRREPEPPWRTRLWTLIGVAIASHVALDACNSYGVHPFYPVDMRWYFGDALFIFEPWLWLVLGLAVCLNVRRRLIRGLLGVPMIALMMVLAYASVISVGTLIAWLGAAIACSWWSRAWTPRMRAAVAAAASVLFIAGMITLSSVARAEVRALVAPDVRGAILDIVLTPNPAAPACWAAIAIERDDADGDGGTVVLRRGTLSLWPSWRSAESCPSHRLVGLQAVRAVGGGRLLWSDEIRQPLARLRRLAADDCWVAAWLQFGRVPVLRTDRIFDLRFENGAGSNFSVMRLRRSADAPSCPAHVTPWAMPRAGDLIDAGGAF